MLLVHNPAQLLVLRTELEELVCKQVLREIPADSALEEPNARISPFFVVPKPHQPGKWRGVADYRRWANENFLAPHFKMESHNDVLSMLQKGDYLVKIDLRDFFYHFKIAEADRPALRVCLNGQVYEPQVHTMGPNFSPGNTTRLFQPLVRIIRCAGIWIV